MTDKPMPGYARAKIGLELNDPVTVTLPAHVWAAFIASYCDSDWKSNAANVVASVAQKAILDPVWISEQEAAAQAQMHEHAQHMMQFNIPGLLGNIPIVPPDASGITDIEQDGDQE